jgi:hypothetical protein
MTRAEPRRVQVDHMIRAFDQNRSWTLGFDEFQR